MIVISFALNMNKKAKQKIYFMWVRRIIKKIVRRIVWMMNVLVNLQDLLFYLFPEKDPPT